MKHFNCFLFAILFISISNSKAEVVYDSDGDELQPGSSYYMVPAIRGGGGGLTLSNFPDKRCPTTVSQEPDSRDNGIPVIISAVGNEEAVISLSSPVNIKFDANLSCAESLVWEEGRTIATFTSIGTLLELARSSSNATSNFRFVKGYNFQSSYMITDYSGDQFLSLMLGIAQRPIVLSYGNLPFNFVFKKAYTDENGHQSLLKMKV